MLYDCFGMCGIVGYLGSRNATDVVLEGLRKLEYRGYDSAGLACISCATHAVPRLDVVRAVGRVDSLAAKVAALHPDARVAIGHTRWATHGRPNELNAHPHRDATGRIALVHNGIVENYAQLRAELSAAGCAFVSETDTEVAAMLVGSLYRGDLVEAVEKAIARIEGAFAFAVISLDHPQMIVGARRGSPLAVGIGDGEMLLGSDALPLIAYTRRVAYLDDDQVAVLEAGRFTLRAHGRAVEPKIQEIRWSVEETDRGGFAHFMLKEIYEQPGALRRLAASLVASPGSTEIQSKHTRDSSDVETARVHVVTPVFNLDSLPLTCMEARDISRIVIVAQGTAFHAGLVARNMIERCARVPVYAEYGSDFRYRDPVLDPSVLVIAVSQSGETADTLGAVRLASERGCTTLSVINTVDSTIARASDGVIYMDAGPEIGVASTKAFTGQIAALYVLAIHLGLLRETLSAADAARRVQDLLQVPGRVEEALANAARVEAVAHKYKDANNALFLGRGTGFPLALEGALKLKEISYIHAEGYDAAEMKHGPIALIDEKMPVVVLALKGRRYEKIVSNIQEVKARGGRVIAIASHDDHEIGNLVDDVLPIHDDRGIMNSIVCAIPLQLFAYYIAVARGCDVDKPRNLAKSVTVE
ncbi:MAG TPA: glutamine--fructose-6-phosphate transaminase (isomerizing) [Planctomycetota bacterium]|nr:glutamine--fructose-6-phosphate transaminase (isomerizing) [Planctomycetota bacterium]